MNINEKMYLDFRKEIDKICVPDILECVKTRPIYCDNELAGIFCYAYQPSHTYIECIYIKPEYRRRGLAKKTVLDWYKLNKRDEIRLHIINRNLPAFEFWTSIFKLEPIEENKVDCLYNITGLRINKVEHGSLCETDTYDVKGGASDA